MEYVSWISLLIRPVHTSVAKCNIMDFFLKLHSQLPFADPPLPVLSYCGRLVHSAAVIQAHIILHRDHTELCTASHNQADKAFLQLFIRRTVWHTQEPMIMRPSPDGGRALWQKSVSLPGIISVITIHRIKSCINALSDQFIRP